MTKAKRQETGGESAKKLRIVGFEGTLAPQRVPARLAPIILDSKRHRFVARDGGYVLVSEEPLPERLPSTATAIEPPMELRARTDFRALGKRDVELWHGAHLAGEIAFSSDMQAQHVRWLNDGSYAAWLCTGAEADQVLAILERQALSELARAVAAKDGQSTYELAWRLQRCAAKDESFFVAAAALQLSPHPERASHLLKGFFPAMPPSEMSGRLKAGAAVLQVRVAAALRGGAMGLAASRVRSAQMQEHAA
jgi:hypothetical protein